MTHNNKKLQSGAIMVEFILVLPFLLTLTFGVIEFSNSLMELNSLNKITMYASRYLSINTKQANGTYNVTNLKDPVENLMKCGIEVSCDNTDTRISASPNLNVNIVVDETTGVITMNVSYPYQSIFSSIFGTNIIPNFTLSSTVIIQAI